MKKIFSIVMALCMMLGLTATLASAQAGPCEDQWDEGSYYAYVLFVRLNEEGEVVFNEDYQAYYAFKDNQPRGELAGAVYDRATNTLTITNLNKPDFLLEINAMGDDFKINVVGECSLSRISVWGWGWGAGLTVTGNGQLTLNENKTGYHAVSINPEGADIASLHVTGDVTLDMYSPSGVAAAYATNYGNPPFIFESYEAYHEKELDIESVSVDEFYPDYISVYKDGTTERSFQKVTREDDPDGVYGAYKTVWYKDYETGEIDHEGYTVYRLIYVESLDAWVYDPTFGAEFDSGYPIDAELYTEDFEAAGFSVEKDQYDNPVWADYNMLGEFFSSVRYTDGENSYFSYYDWDNELQESFEHFYFITPVEGLENTYFAGEMAEGVTRENVEAAGTTIPGQFTTYIIKDTELHLVPNNMTPCEHVFVDEVIAPTCMGQGYTRHTCSKCGYVDEDTFTDALGHDYQVVKVNEPTCIEFGSTVYECTRCGDGIAMDLVDPLGHDWDGGVVTTPATKTSEGVKTYTCKRCSETKTEVIPKISDELIDTTKIFKDVKPNKWYTEPINYVYTKGLMNGMTDTTFEPNSNMSRAMLVTVLWRAEGSPAPKGATPFTDLKAKWYKDAVAWAYENSIVKGMSDTTFAPNNSITREQIAAIFYRYAEFKGEDVSKRADISKFPDGSKVSKYARDAMSWAVAEGLISGTKVGDKDYLDPKGNATRAQVATILMRYLESR